MKQVTGKYRAALFKEYNKQTVKGLKFYCASKAAKGVEEVFPSHPANVFFRIPLKDNSKLAA